MLALQHYRDGLCPLCGMPSDICQNPANELKVRASDPVRCHFTTAASVRREVHTGGKNGKAKPNQPHALIFGAELKP